MEPSGAAADDRESSRGERVLEEQPGGRRLRLTNDQRRRLAAKGKQIERRLLRRDCFDEREDGIDRLVARTFGRRAAQRLESGGVAPVPHRAQNRGAEPRRPDRIGGAEADAGRFWPDTHALVEAANIHPEPGPLVSRYVANVWTMKALSVFE